MMEGATKIHRKEFPIEVRTGAISAINLPHKERRENNRNTRRKEPCHQNIIKRKV